MEAEEDPFESASNGVARRGDLQLIGKGTPLRSAQALSDLVVLLGMACQTPAVLLSLPQSDGSWTTFASGLEGTAGLEERPYFDALAARMEPVQHKNLPVAVPESTLVHPPYNFRWAYGVAIRAARSAESVVAVVAVLDKSARHAGARERRALHAVVRPILGYLTQYGRPSSPSALAPKAGAPSVRSANLSSVNASTPKPASATSMPIGPIGEPALMRSEEVAQLFEVTSRTVLNWANSGKLPSRRTPTGHLRFRPEDVQELLR